MTYAQIKQLALQQLDEDPADMAEFGEMLGMYVNEGYQTALLDHLRPKETYTLSTNEDGDANIEGLGIVRVTDVREAEHGYSAWATLSGMGDKLHTAVKDGKIKVLAIVAKKDMVLEGDVPQIPEWAHSALADYACFRFLSNGNMAKQSRAQFYYQRFATAMQRIMPQGSGSVTGYRNLYAVTDARWTR